MNKKNVLITGCLGFIGAATVNELMKREYHVKGIDNNCYYGMNRLRDEQIQRDERIRITMGDWDICKPFPIGRFDAVIHLAAIPGVRDSIRDPETYYRNNLMGTLNVLELMREYKIPKLVFASTSSIYDWNHASYRPMPECGTDLPQHPYAGSKLAAEDLCRMYHELHGLDVSVLRYHTVYGPSGRPDMFPLKAVRWICEGEEIQLNGDGSQERDFTYIDDVVDANIKAMNHKSGFEVFNIGAGMPYTLNELIEFIAKYTGKHAKIKTNNQNNLDAGFTWADNSKAEKMLGWKPKRDLESGIWKTVDWYRENREALKGIEF